jgi:hypothetical protein
MGVNEWIRPGRVRTSPHVSLWRSFKNNGLGLQVRCGCPAGQRPRSRMRQWCVVRVCVRPPLLMDASRVRQREAEEVFDLDERQDYGVRVSMLQVLIQWLIFARHHWPFGRIDGRTAHTPGSRGRHGGFHSTPSALKTLQHLGQYLGRLAPPVSVLGSESDWCVPHAVHSVHRSARFI